MSRRQEQLEQPSPKLDIVQPHDIDIQFITQQQEPPSNIVKTYKKSNTVDLEQLSKHLQINQDQGSNMKQSEIERTSNQNRKKYLIVAPINASFGSKKEILKLLRKQLSLNTDQRHSTDQNNNQNSLKNQYQKVSVNNNEDNKDIIDDSYSSEDNSFVSLYDDDQEIVERVSQSNTDCMIDDDVNTILSKDKKIQQMQSFKNPLMSAYMNQDKGRIPKPEPYQGKIPNPVPLQRSISKETLLRRSKFQSQQSAPLPVSQDRLNSDSNNQEPVKNVKSKFGINNRNNFDSAGRSRKVFGNLSKNYRRAGTLKVEDDQNLDIIQESQSIEEDNEEAKSPGQQKTVAQQRWVKVKNFFKTINLLKYHDAKRLEAASDIMSEIRRFPKKQQTEDFEKFDRHFLGGNDSYQNMRRQQKFFNAIAQGGEQAATKIKFYLEKDPKQHMYETSNDNHMINKANTFGLRPLYIACLHGHYDVAKVLVQLGANPHLLSVTDIDLNQNESNLQVCARWNHVQILELLLTEDNWSKQEILSAMKETSKRCHAHKILADYCKKKFGSCYASFCLP